VIARTAAGNGHNSQLIAANVDTLFVVTACNADFNPSRLERYLAVAHEARVAPVIVLTKVDTCPDPTSYVHVAQSTAGHIPVLALNATDVATSLALLGPWLEEGQTVTFVGSSGVGKSTLINSLSGTTRQPTREIRKSDGRGRHTTTARYLLRAPCGAWLIDTPGMRELGIGAVQEGLGRTFADIESLARECRFRDCSHRDEAGCAVRAAMEQGRIECRRLQNYLKLAREVERASMPTWRVHQESRRAGRLSRAAQQRRRKDTGRE
jgi:ribosome biogenesis GTPase